MPLTLRFTPPSPRAVTSGETFTVSIELNWLASDTAPPENQRLNITLPMPQPIQDGTATLLNPVGPPPALVTPQMGSFVAATATTEGRLSYLVAIRAGNIGNVRFTFSLENMAAVTADYDLVVAPGAFNLITTGFTQRAISVANVDNLTPATAPDNLKSVLEIRAESLATPPVPVPNATITIFIESVTADVVRQAGNYFNVTGAAVPINVQRNDDETGSFTLQTNAAGIARLEIDSNTRSGFISCRISGGVNSIVPPVLYIYDQPNNLSTMPEPVVVLPKSNLTNFDTTNYTRNTFPIQINTRLNQSSSCVAILNNRYQEDQPVSVFNNNRINLNGRTSDLIVSANGSNNSVFYAVSDGPQLISSRALVFGARNDNGGTDPNGILLAKLDNPKDGVLTFDDIVGGLRVVILLGENQQQLQEAGRPALAAPNVCRLFATINGFDANGNPIAERRPIYEFPIANFAAATVTNSVNVFPEFADLGRSRDGQQPSRWEMSYAYFANAASTTPLVSSQAVRGDLATRPIQGR
ncbi:hypothetical protein [Pseudochrobactrum asaccharolyticum]|uniref:hypothetical protein n=1 Tax=Pseudochrobactrum asaccharolyticum TaxID=354351 RepID=UPI004042BFA2